SLELIEAARGAYPPPDGSRDRVRKRVVARVGVAAFTATSVAAALWVKVGATVLVIALACGVAYWKFHRPPAAPPGVTTAGRAAGCPAALRRSERDGGGSRACGCALLGADADHRRRRSANRHARAHGQTARDDARVRDAADHRRRDRAPARCRDRDPRRRL